MMFACIIALFCCGCIEKSPNNSILFWMFTGSISVTVAVYTLQFALELVLIALGITMFVFVLLTMYCWWSKKDFEFLNGFLSISLIVLIVLGIIFAIFPVGGLLEAGLSFFGIMVFVCFILYDTSRLVNKKDLDLITSREMLSAEIMIASIGLYLDIINLFLYILDCLAAVSDDN